DVPPPVGLLVELAPAGLLLLLVGDDRLDPPLPQPLPQPAGRVPLVPGHLRRLLRPGRGLLQQRDGLLRLVLLPRADGHRHRRPLPVADQVQLRPEAPLAAAQRVVPRLPGREFFFEAPAADWRARTTVPSMQNSSQSISPECLLGAWSRRRILSQSPRRAQLRKRS